MTSAVLPVSGRGSSSSMSMWIGTSSGRPTLVASSSAIPAITPASYWTSVNCSGVTSTRATLGSGLLGGGRCFRLRLGLDCHLGEIVDLVVAEAGHLAELARELDRVLVGLAPEPTQAEQLVDRALELERLFSPLRVVLGQPAQPVRAHLHVRDLVGEHPVLARRQYGIPRVVTEELHRVEHVDRQALERTVHAREAQQRILRAGRLVEERRLAELADLGAHVLGELHRDLAVARLVPRLPGPVELELERHVLVVEVERGAAGSFEGLELAHEDAVHQLAGPVGCRRALGLELGGAGVALGDLHLARIHHCFLDLHPDEARVASELLDGEDLLHPTATPSDASAPASSLVPMLPGPVMPPAASTSCSRSRWRFAARSTSSGVEASDCSSISPSRQSSNSSCIITFSERIAG